MRLLVPAFAIVLVLAFLPSVQAQPDQPSLAPCQGPNDHVWRDLADTREDPTHPECGSLSDPCWMNGGRCGGCGPPILEWIVGPIYCV